VRDIDWATRPSFISAFPSVTIAFATVRGAAGRPLSVVPAGGVMNVLSGSVIG